MKKMLAFLLSLVMLLSLAGVCFAEEGALITEDITINIRAMNQYTNLDRILEKYYELVADDPNLKHVKLNFHYVTGADYMDKLTTAIVAQEDIDLMFVGSWQGRTNYINDGVFKELTPYLTDEVNYPGLAQYYTDEFLNAQKVNGGIYYAPLGAITELPGVVYREDLRKAYGCEPITDEATLMAYLQTIQAHIDDGSLDMTVPWGVSQEQGFMSFRNESFEGPQNGVYPLNVGTDFFLYIEDGKVVNAVVAGDDEAQFAGFPEGYNYDFIAENYVSLLDWMPYCNNTATEGDEYVDFNMGQSAVTYHCLSEVGPCITALKQAVPEAEVGFYVFNEAMRNCEQNAIPTTFAANNSVAIPAWSSEEKTVAAMCFLDALYGRKEINDLFMYGVEGEDWVEGEGKVVNYLRNSDDPNYYFYPVYSLVYTPGEFNYYPDWVAQDENLIKYWDYEYNTNTSYTVTPLAGFAFDNAPVEIERAALSGVVGTYQFNFGVYETVEATQEKIAEQHILFEQAGLEIIRQEVINQVQAYLDSQAK